MISNKQLELERTICFFNQVLGLEYWGGEVGGDIWFVPPYLDPDILGELR